MEKSNCSTFDPCGRYGYCADDKFDRWTCSCVFWWSGELCDQFSNSGIQVIILSCLLLLLIGMYYGLVFYRSQIWKKFKNGHDFQAKFSVKIKITVGHTACLFALLVILITVAMLLIKWAVIRPMHDDMVYLYHSNSSLSSAPRKICQKIFYRNLNLIMLGLACALTVILALPYARLPYLRQKCGTSFGSLVPADFFTDTDRKLIAAVFVLCADQLLEVVKGTFDDSSSSSDNGIVLSFLQEISRVLMLGLRYYPVLVGIYLDSLWSLMLSVSYVMLEFAMHIVARRFCPGNQQSMISDVDGTSRYFLFDHFGTGSFLVTMELLIDTPRFFCLSYIVVKLTQKIHQKLRNRSKIDPNVAFRSLTLTEKIVLHVLNPDSAEIRYIRNLLTSKKRDGNRCSRWLYEWRDDFRYSSRVLAVFSSIFLFLYVIVIQLCILMPIVFTHLQIMIQIWIYFYHQNRVTLPKNFFLRSFLIATAFGSIVVIIQLFLLLKGIRRNLLQAYRGDYSEVLHRDRSTYVSHAIENFHFCGYLIAYTLWSFTLMVFWIFVILLLIDGMITFYGVYYIKALLTYYIPLIFLIYFKDYLNKLLTRFVFLQETGDVLAIKNRQIFMIFLYFSFYVDALLGIVSSIMRLVKSVVGGIVYMGRLDYSPLGRKLETHDDGYSAYCGFIHTECTHRHPILLVFAAHLLEQQKKRQTRNLLNHSQPMHSHRPTNDIELNRKVSNRFTRKWHVLVLLLRNPSLAAAHRNTKMLCMESLSF